MGLQDFLKKLFGSSKEVAEKVSDTAETTWDKAK